jgi:hypothetical protein
VLSQSAALDASLQKSNSFNATKVITCTGTFAGLTAYNNANYTLRLDVSSWNGYYVKSYSEDAASFRTTAGVTYLDLDFDYKTTYQALGPNDPGTWTLYAVDSTGAAINLLEANIQIKKVTAGEIDFSALSSSGPVKFTAKQGDTFHRQVTWSGDSGPINLTGYTARMQIRNSYTSSTALLSLTQVSGLTLGGANGTIDIDITSIQTTALAVGTYVYDLEMTSGSEVTTILEGTFVVTAQATL